MLGCSRVGMGWPVFKLPPCRSVRWSPFVIAVVVFITSTAARPPPPRCLFPVSHTFIIAYFSFLLSELFHSLPLPPLLSSILAPSSMSACTVTFVFDSALPPQQYTKLVQPDGIIYKLIQRLEEKHGGDDYVRIYSFSSPSLFFT